MVELIAGLGGILALPRRRLQWAVTMSAAQRGGILCGIASLMALLIGAIVYSLPARHQVAASFEWRAVPTAHGRELASTFVPTDCLEECLEFAKQCVEQEGLSRAAAGLSLHHAEAEDASHKVSIHVVDWEPSHAQTTALVVARAMASQLQSMDPRWQAHENLASAEAAFQYADRAWAVALQQTWAGDKNPTPPVVKESLDACVTPASALSEDAFETTVEQALANCQQHRQSIADIYTDQHPAVVHLDQQIRWLEKAASHGSAVTAATRLLGSTNDTDSVGLASATVKGSDNTPIGVAPAAAVASESKIEPMESGKAVEPLTVADARRERSKALAELSLAQSRFESVMQSEPCIRYSEVRLDPSPIHELGPNRQRLFLCLMVATMLLLTTFELLVRRASRNTGLIAAPA